MASELHSVTPSTAYSLDSPVAPSQSSGEPRYGAARRFGEGAQRLESASRVAAFPNSRQAEKAKEGDSETDLTKAVESLNGHLQALRRDLQFSVDDDSGKTVVKVLDAETEEVIRQIPPEEVLELQKRLEEAAGVIFRGEA